MEAMQNRVVEDDRALSRRQVGSNARN